jgi:hypothetical protein
MPWLTYLLSFILLPQNGAINSAVVAKIMRVRRSINSRVGAHSHYALAMLEGGRSPDPKLVTHELETYVTDYARSQVQLLSESRKYKLGLVIGTQTLSQLPESTVAAIFGNGRLDCKLSGVA